MKRRSVCQSASPGRLEAQEGGVRDALDLEGAVREWMTTRLKQLWD